MNTKMMFIFMGIMLPFLSCNVDEQKKNEPEKISSDSPQDNAIHERRLQTLKKLNEPDLRTYDKESFRFILYQHLHGSLMLFRVDKDSLNSVSMTIKYFLTGNEKDSLLKEMKKDLTLADWDTLVRKSREAYFWSLEYLDNPAILNCDGVGWLIEGKRNLSKFEKSPQLNAVKDYTMVSRACPYRGSFFELGAAMATMSGEMERKELDTSD
jgi:hypothetical protein